MRRKKPEILFKGHHVPHLPWMEYTAWDHIPLLPNKTYVPYQNVKINIEKLCHVTHDEEFYKINKGDRYVFIPRQKFGKAGYNYDGAPIGESYVICEPSDVPPNHQTRYRYVSKDEEVLPGYYIWWSIDHSCIFPREPYLNLMQNTGREVYGYYTHEPFNYPIKSRYGNHKFTSDIKELLQCYQNAYGSPLPHIEFRCGGTLRYRNEICYVVIVCAVHPDSEHPLSKDEFPIWKDLEVEYVNGKIVSIQIKIRNGISGVYCHGVINKKTKPFSWDTYVFALYFPDSKYRLELPKRNTTTSLIEHNFCIKTKPDPLNNNKFTCPNHLPYLMDDHDTSDETDQIEDIEEFITIDNEESVWQILNDSEESEKVDEQEHMLQVTNDTIDSEEDEHMWQVIYNTINSDEEHEHMLQVTKDTIDSEESDEDEHLWRVINDTINSDEEDQHMCEVIKDTINSEESDEDKHLWRVINDTINSDEEDQHMCEVIKDTINSDEEDEHMCEVIKDTINSEESDEEDEHMWQEINNSIDSQKSDKEHIWHLSEEKRLCEQ